MPSKCTQIQLCALARLSLAIHSDHTEPLKVLIQCDPSPPSVAHTSEGRGVLVGPAARCLQKEDD